MSQEQEIRRQIDAASKTEYEQALVDGKVRIALELRNLVFSSTDRERKETLMAGKLYQPSLAERFKWAVQDGVNLVRDRFHFLR